ncbi:hypothetical protein ABIF62_002000 [Bradyrhizobium japonicum]
MTPKASLATLLIISSIDLLLCSFTMGVMLFLIFQPTQREDRGSAITQGSAANRTGIPSFLGQHASPAIVVVENLTENRLMPSSVPAGYRKVDSTSNPGRTLVFVVYPGRDPSSLILETEKIEAGQKAEAQISVASQGTLIKKSLKCSAGGRTTIEIGDVTNVEIACQEAVSICTSRHDAVDSDFSLDGSEIDLLNSYILLVGATEVRPNVKLTEGSSVCLASPNFTDNSQLSYMDEKLRPALATIAKDQCNARIPAGATLATPDEAQCIFSVAQQRLPAQWRARCWPSVLLAPLQYDRAHLLFASNLREGVCANLTISK